MQSDEITFVWESVAEMAEIEGWARGGYNPFKLVSLLTGLASSTFNRALRDAYAGAKRSSGPADGGSGDDGDGDGDGDADGDAPMAVPPVTAAASPPLLPPPLPTISNEAFDALFGDWVRYREADAYFDARVHAVADLREAVANVVWRSIDCLRNAASQFAKEHGAAAPPPLAECPLGQGKATGNSALKVAAAQLECGAALAATPPAFRYGTFVLRTRGGVIARSDVRVSLPVTSDMVATLFQFKG